jgi:hypothetical protein
MKKVFFLPLISIYIFSCSVKNTSEITEVTKIPQLPSNSPKINNSNNEIPISKSKNLNEKQENNVQDKIPDPLPTNITTENNSILDTSKEKIAFISNFNEICNINPDGTNLKRVKLLNKISFNEKYQYYYRWSPNHKKLLYLVQTKLDKIKGLESYGVDQYSFDIQIVNFDGTYESKVESFNLSSSSDSPDIKLSWSPDSKKISFISNEVQSLNDMLTKKNVKHNIIEIDNQNKILSKYIIDNIGYEDTDTDIGGNADLSNIFLKWSPDSKMVLFNTVRKSRTENKQEIQINYQELGSLFKQSIDKIYGNSIAFIEWSDNSKDILYDYGSDVSTQYSYSLATKKITEVLKKSIPYFSFLNYQIPITQENISQDNKKIVYECSDNYGSGICINDGTIKNILSSSKLTYYPNKKDFDSQPNFSFDSKKVFFISKKDNKNGELYITDIDKNNEKRLTLDENIDSDPVWINMDN